MALLMKQAFLALALLLVPVAGPQAEEVGTAPAPAQTEEELAKKELEAGLAAARKLPVLSFDEIFKSYKWGASEEEVKALLAKPGLNFTTTENTNRGTTAFFTSVQLPFKDVERPFVKITWVFFPPRGLMYSYMSFAVQPKESGALDLMEAKLIPFYDKWFGVKGVNLLEPPYYKYQWRNGQSMNLTLPVAHEGTERLAVLVSSTYGEAIYGEYQAMFPNIKPEGAGEGGKRQVQFLDTSGGGTVPPPDPAPAAPKE